MMILEFSFMDVVDVLIPPKKRIWLARMLLVGCAVGTVASLISYTIIKGG